MSKWPEDFVTNILNDVEKYICGLFKHYGIYFDEIINGERHKNEVQCNKKDCVPSKLPSK